MFKVVKRDGEVASFNIGKITNAIEKAFKATDKQFNTDIIELLGLRVTADFQNKIKDGLIDVEEHSGQRGDRAGSEPAMPMWQRPTSSTASSARRSGT